VVIDAVRHLDHIKSVITGHGANLRYVFDTHLQADHVSGGRELAGQAGCDYGMHPLDAVGAAHDFLPLEDGRECSFGNSSMRVLHTPGHTPGSTSFLLDERFLFGGDTVMETTVGRPDLGGMVDVWGELLFQTIHQKLGSLGDEIMVCPTHAASVRERDDSGVVGLTLGEARSILPLFKMKDKEKFMAQVRTTLMENPERYQDIRKVNLGMISPDEKTVSELEIGKNLCGMAEE
jgi:glyoxylase-like metal-dependent hydrolase (beta-lactamase superfamily II)